MSEIELQIINYIFIAIIVYNILIVNSDKFKRFTENIKRKICLKKIKSKKSMDEI